MTTDNGDKVLDLDEKLLAAVLTTTCVATYQEVFPSIAAHIERAINAARGRVD
jgi:hypothetical protein